MDICTDQWTNGQTDGRIEMRCRISKHVYYTRPFFVWCFGWPLRIHHLFLSGRAKLDSIGFWRHNQRRCRFQQFGAKYPATNQFQNVQLVRNFGIKNMLFFIQRWLPIVINLAVLEMSLKNETDKSNSIWSVQPSSLLEIQLQVDLGRMWHPGHGIYSMIHLDCNISWRHC